MQHKHPHNPHRKDSKTKEVKHETQQEFELPEAIEKQTHKFILDTLKERMLQEDLPHTRQIIETTEIVLPSEAPAAPTADLPEGKNYFRVREVAALLDVGPHVLRFWETEFSMVRPTKSKSGQRVYRRKDVEVLQRIKHLLHEQKLSIRAAREILLQERKERLAAEAEEHKEHKGHPHRHHIRPERVAATPITDRPLDLKELLVDLRQLIRLVEQDPFSYRATPS